MKTDNLYLQHILEAMEKIERYVGQSNFETFSKNDMMVDAVVRELEIIGEAANKCSENFRKNHSIVPWLEIVGMRNRLIHEYFGVDLNVVWTTCKEDLPNLKNILKKTASTM